MLRSLLILATAVACSTTALQAQAPARSQAKTQAKPRATAPLPPRMPVKNPRQSNVIPAQAAPAGGPASRAVEKSLTTAPAPTRALSPATAKAVTPPGAPAGVMPPEAIRRGRPARKP